MGVADDQAFEVGVGGLDDHPLSVIGDGVMLQLHAAFVGLALAPVVDEVDVFAVAVVFVTFAFATTFARGVLMVLATVEEVKAILVGDTVLAVGSALVGDDQDDLAVVDVFDDLITSLAHVSLQI